MAFCRRGWLGFHHRRRSRWYWHGTPRVLIHDQVVVRLDKGSPFILGAGWIKCGRLVGDLNGEVLGELSVVVGFM